MPLIAQRASAGSGKTEQLARRYLQILFSPDASGHNVDPATILATTFTREAAGEILARIFRILANASLHEEARLALFHEEDESLPSAAMCEQLLRRIIEKMDRLMIGTIDALFAKQAHMLALDLGLAPHWKIADPLISLDLAQKAVIQLLEKKTTARNDWSQLHYFTRQLSFVEKATMLLESQRALANAKPLFSRRISDQPPSFLPASQAKEVLNFLATFEIPVTSKGKPDARWKAAIQKLQKSFSQTLLIKNILGLSTVIAKCLHHFSEQPSFNGTMIPLEFLAIFSPLAEASACEEERLELLREQSLARLLKAYDEERKRISFCSGNYTFSEIEEVLQPTSMLAMIDGETPIGEQQFSREEIAFRMESSIEHLLLDEYQDTSQCQHNFLSSLVGDVLAKGGNVFVVGDLKQGIYGWRGGKRHLLDLLEKEHEAHAKVAPALNQSYRSSQAVLDAVNEVFGALQNPEALSLMDGGKDFWEAAAQWSVNFQPHQGAERVKELRGDVQLHEVTVADESADERMASVVQQVVERVEYHRSEDPEREIAILTRRTKFIPQLLLALRCRDILASGEGGNPLADTLAVESLLSLLLWMDHPGHSAAYEHIKNSPLQHLLQDELANHEPPPLRAKLTDRGYASFLRMYATYQPFQIACSSYEIARVEQLLAMAEQFDASGGGSPSDFVKRVRTERVESPLNTGVRVLTIHAAKGLEFESVILMDLDADIFTNRGDSVRVQTTDHGEFFIQTNQELMVRQGREELLHNINKEQWAEALSLLYVGMTRAASYLDLVLLGNFKRRSTKTMAAWLRASGLRNHYRDGISWKEMKQSSRKETQHAAPEHKKQYLTPYRGVKKLSKRSPSEKKEGLVLMEQKLHGNVARHEGILIHALLSELLWNNKNMPTAQQLCSLVSSPLGHHKVLSTASYLLELLQQRNDPFAAVFEEKSFLKKWEKAGVTQLTLWRERAFAVVIEPELITGIFDRVVIGSSADGKAMVAEIIDFKTDHLNGEEQKRRAKEYAAQLETYREALKNLIPELKAIETKLVWILPESLRNDSIEIH